MQTRRIDMKEFNENWLKANQASWNERVTPHLNSEMYNLKAFKAGASSLNSIELELLGDLTGKSILHLQCHFGQDTMSFARMGARSVGVDLSDAAIDAARKLNNELGLDCEFHCCNVLDTRDHVSEKFDHVFTSYGTITWLPDLEPWSKVVADSLLSGGKFTIVEFHPMMWSLDDEFKTFGYDYFNRKANCEIRKGTYADPEADIETKSYWWNHPTSELVKALLDQGLTLEHMDEYDYSAYECLPGMIKVGDRKYRFEHLGDQIPYMFSMVWTKP